MKTNKQDNQTILIVDDETDLLKGLSRSLKHRLDNIHIITAGNGKDALVKIKSAPDMVLLDIKMPGMGGMEVLDSIMASQPETTVVMMTAFGSIELAVEALRRGAWDFVTKPLDLDSLARLIRRGLERSQLQRVNAQLRDQLESDKNWQNFTGSSPAIKQLQQSIDMVARTEYTVLILGASGTGKEIAARMIHHLSPRREKPFIMVNCPAIPEHLLESELFGYRRGAFTGADSNHEGMFVQASGGTICLDEIGDIPVSLQTKLLRVLQNKEIKVLGSRKTTPIDVRILASTNQDLLAKIREGSFREDLYYRLNVVSLLTPRLDEIPEDITLLANHFLRQACAELGCQQKSFSLEALRLLSRRQWPGNARELQNTVRRAAMFCPQEIIEAKYLDSPTPNESPQEALVEAEIEHYKEAKETCLKSFTQTYISNLLHHTTGNISQAARLSGLTRAALQRIMKRHDIDVEQFRVPGKPDSNRNSM